MQRGSKTSANEPRRVRDPAAMRSPSDLAEGLPGRPLIRVLVVEDQRALASALEIALAAQPDLDCIGAVGTAEEAITLVASRSPDVVLMDIGLPGTDGIVTTRRIRAIHPRIRVLILTGDATPGRLAEAAAAGAAAFLAKDSAFPDILAAIRAPIDGKILVEEVTMAALMNTLPSANARRGGRSPDWGTLTTREREVLFLMGEGLDPRAIAERLVISLHTARGHVKNIMMKLDAHSQLEVVVVATRAGLLSESEAARKTS
ncbi:MAG TPA: response regulator transcription factor [Streptosporangiaceae bacterium]|nr:response regulator transcription factor [Streptosporangiaceae bacterium]